MKNNMFPFVVGGVLLLGSFSAFGQSINGRRTEQQDRIAQGIRSGSLRPGETARLENREQGINQQIRADRQANGGKLTASERRQVNRRQNRASRHIYRAKH